MARDESFRWSEEALEDFAALLPSDDEIHAVDGDMADVLKQRIERVGLDYDWASPVLFRSGRFGVTFWLPQDEEEAEILSVFPWPTEDDSLLFDVPRQKQWTTVEVLYATNRNWLGDDFSTYGVNRSPLSFGFAEVTIPHLHKIGHLEAPSLRRLDFGSKPAKHVTVHRSARELHNEFFTRLAGKVTASETREVLIFIHGYNVTFQDALRRTAQIAFDLRFPGVPVLYSWPSAGRGTAYIKDETNIHWTVSDLRDFLVEVLNVAGAKAIHLLAHSMGNRALANVLEMWRNDREAAPFNHVVLTAPDIDAETFKRSAAFLCENAKNVTLYSSAKDKALVLSKKFHGYPRAGEAIVIVQGMDTIDASAVNTSFMGHSHFAENRSVIEDIYWLIRNHPPETRFGITRKELPEGFYYVFRP